MVGSGPGFNCWPRKCYGTHFVVFLRSSTQIPGYSLILGHAHVFPHSFQFINCLKPKRVMNDGRRHFILGGGRKNIFLFEGSQAMPIRHSEQDIMEAKAYEWCLVKTWYRRQRDFVCLITECWSYNLESYIRNLVPFTLRSKFWWI
jgi:hypothetical protein